MASTFFMARGAGSGLNADYVASMRRKAAAERLAHQAEEHEKRKACSASRLHEFDLTGDGLISKRELYAALKQIAIEETGSATVDDGHWKKVWCGRLFFEKLDSEALLHATNKYKGLLSAAA